MRKVSLKDNKDMIDEDICSQKTVFHQRCSDYFCATNIQILGITLILRIAVRRESGLVEVILRGNNSRASNGELQRACANSTTNK